MKDIKNERAIPPELIDGKTAARIAGVSIDTLRRLSREGGAPAPLHVRGSVRWRLRDVLEWIEAGCPSGPAAPKGVPLDDGDVEEVNHAS